MWESWFTIILPKEKKNEILMHLNTTCMFHVQDDL